MKKKKNEIETKKIEIEIIKAKKILRTEKIKKGKI